jgi:predicted negative regulator of RcsB-dependent stress response
MFFETLKQFWKPITVLVLMFAMLFGGWKANDVYHGYKDNLNAQITKQFEQGLSDIQAQGAKNLIETQELIKQNKAQIIEKEVPYIVEKKVYSNQCFDETGVAVLKKLKDESAKRRTN